MCVCNSILVYESDSEEILCSYVCYLDSLYLEGSQEVFISAAENFKGFFCSQLILGILIFFQTRVWTHAQSSKGNQADGKPQLQRLQCERVQKHTEFNLDEAKSSVYKKVNEMRLSKTDVAASILPTHTVLSILTRK